MNAYYIGRAQAGASSEASRFILHVPLPHHYELHQDMPQGITAMSADTITGYYYATTQPLLLLVRRLLLMFMTRRKLLIPRLQPLY